MKGGPLVDRSFSSLHIFSVRIDTASENASNYRLFTSQRKHPEHSDRTIGFVDPVLYVTGNFLTFV